MSIYVRIICHISRKIYLVTESLIMMIGATRFLILVMASLLMSSVVAFSVKSSSLIVRNRMIKMEYIPDGLNKEQWALIKKKEAEELKLKGNQGSLGVKKFKSRSFEAWHKAGAKHLFPVDPTTATYEERPYMQRKNGDWEGNDLKAIGLQGKGQGVASQRLEIDNLYEGLKKAGKLDSSSIFGGAPLPWTSSAANKIGSELLDGAVTKPAVASKKLSPEEMSRLKATLFKPVVTKKEAEPEKKVAPPAKKGFFGLF